MDGWVGVVEVVDEFMVIDEVEVIDEVMVAEVVRGVKMQISTPSTIGNCFYVGFF